MADDVLTFAHPGPLDAQEALALLDACRRVVESNSYVLGHEVAAFESSWACYLGAPGSVGVANGLDALEIGLRALGIGPGDEVVVPAISAMATPLAVHRAGATPVFCDIEPETALLSLDHAADLITQRTRAVIPVHLYGRAVDMPRLLSLTETHGVRTIEDAAQAHGARIHGRSVGTWGDAAGFSLYPTKNLGALGDAGAVVSMDRTVLESARTLRNYGQRSLYDHVLPGANSRLDELQAAILSVRLDSLEQRNGIRRQIARRFFAEIANPYVSLLREPEDSESYVAHLFVLLADNRDSFMRHMAASGVACLIHYPKALPDQLASEAWNGSGAQTPEARDHARRCVSLPCRPGMSHSEVDRVIDAVNDYRPEVGR